jgi:Protein of unknown function (DUF3047)
MTHLWLAIQTLTNLALLSPGPGLPPPWTLVPAPHANLLSVRVTTEHTLRIEAAGQAGTAVYRLRRPLVPREASAALSWRWRTSTPVAHAMLRDPSRDDTPAGVVVLFDDGRTLMYAWGSAEPIGDVFLTGRSGRRAVVVCRRAEDANGSWYLESHDPFADYRRAFTHAPHPIVAVGVGAGTDHLHNHTVADVSDLSWD